MDGQTHVVVVLGTEIPGDDHPCADGDAAQKADEHEDKAAGGADRGQRVAAQKVAHNQGVGGVIELLKEIAEEDGQRKKGDAFANGAVEHGGSAFLLQVMSLPVRRSPVRQSRQVHGPL